MFQKPVFTEPLTSLDIAEAESGLLECRLIPVGDPKLRVEWYLNEQPLQQSNRLPIAHEFGHVSLQLSHALPHDTGVYMCRAVNDLGEAVTTASVNVIRKSTQTTMVSFAWLRLHVTLM